MEAGRHEMYSLRCESVVGLNTHSLKFDTEEAASYFAMLWDQHWVPGVTFVMDGWTEVQTKLPRKRKPGRRSKDRATLEEIVACLTEKEAPDGAQAKVA